MKYITPEIEINIIQTEDIMAISDGLSGIAVSGTGNNNALAEDSVDVRTDSSTTGGIKVNVGADFFA